MKKRFKELRETLGLTQKDFSEKIKMAQSSYGQLESGIRNINDRTVKLICQEFNVNERWLKTGEGYMFEIAVSFEDFFGMNYKFLDEVDKKIITEYMKLSADHRGVIKEFIRKMI